MSNQRDELAGVIRAVTDLWDEPLDEVHDIPPLANALIAAGYRKPRTVTTVAELAALPMGSKVVSAGYEWTKNYATTNTPSGGIEREVWFNVYDDFDAAEDIHLPATVLYEPTR